MYNIDNRQVSKPYPLGVTTEFGYTYFSVVMKNGKNCGIILYDKKTGKETRIPFKECNKFGSIYSLAVKDLETERYAYNFYDGEHIFTDPYAKIIHGHEKWGKQNSFLKGGFLSGDFEWEEDKPLKIPYEESILYCLNVRAFTRHKSSGVVHKGTFQGIIEKIPYLKELGVTAIELMPVYEFDELETEEFKQPSTMTEAREQMTNRLEPDKEALKKYNCWGYKEAYYFAPKAAFGASADTAAEFKDLVKTLHQNGMEIIMQFYFPATVNQGLMMDAVKYWVLEYHIDGVHLKGEHIPLQGIATEPLLTDTKLFYYHFPYEQIYEESEIPKYRNLASYKDDYMYAVRRFLKGDDNMLGTFLELQRKNPNKHGIINYITNYYGFTLMDMVSYEKKHNEANGENNEDGNDYNFTWNCGVEGASKKKSIQRLRIKQIKNALSILFLSQGTPLLYSGDELGNTRMGNNNPYCQDNAVGWVKWNMTEMGRQIFTYTKELIALKKLHPVLRNPRELRILDYIGCGYPDISYHGEEAWRPEINNYSRFAGVMYCGYYAKKEREEDDSFFYIAYNMHWISHTFALPKLPRGLNWCLIADTGKNEGIAMTKELTVAAQEQQLVEVEARTIQIYISKQEESMKPDDKRKYIRSAF